MLLVLATDASGNVYVSDGALYEVQNRFRPSDLHKALAQIEKLAASA